MKYLNFKKEVALYLASTLTLFAFALVGFSAVEQGLVLAADTATVYTRQQITAELALTVASTNLTLTPSIPGLTGGTGNVSDTVTVVTNNNTGYNVTVVGTTYAPLPVRMIGETQGGYINDYASLTPQTWSNTNAGGSPQYGFGITNGSKTNTATGYTTCTTLEHCWARVPTSTPLTVMNVTTETTATGDNFTLKFRVHLPANPDPLPPEDFYQSTTTLTALMN